MMNANEFSRLCNRFCEHPASMEGMDDLVSAYPYFQLARLMACYGTPDSPETGALAFRTDDRSFLYRFLSGKLQLARVEGTRPDSLADIPREIGAENGRSALQVLNDMLEKYKNNPPKVVASAADIPEENVYEDLGKSSNMERMNFVSETLAKLYVEQKEYDRAIKIYKVLMEKQPEKSELFAASMDAVKAMKNA
jgi:hypothetical protein